MRKTFSLQVVGLPPYMRQEDLNFLKIQLKTRIVRALNLNEPQVNTVAIKLTAGMLSDFDGKLIIYFASPMADKIIVSKVNQEVVDVLKAFLRKIWGMSQGEIPTKPLSLTVHFTNLSELDKVEKGVEEEVSLET